jgi:CRISPR-associated endonuclease/helicase Cas3
MGSSQRLWRWYVRPADADDDGSKSARFDQLLGDHLNSAEGFAQGLASKLDISAPETTAIRLAAKWHDLGKDRPLWQGSIGNRDPSRPLAKSKGRMGSVDLSSYRHEFGSLLDLRKLPEFAAQPDDVKELVLHLVAAHHGRARPHFPQVEVFDPKNPQRDAEAFSLTVPRRFARLQRKYGRWGLAWLESLVRAADVLASQPPKGVQK